MAAANLSMPLRRVACCVLVAEIIVFCNPNNPTGACATRAQLQSLVDFALESALRNRQSPQQCRAAHVSSDAQIVCRFLLCLPIDGSADKQIIIYDSAYAPFIQDPDKPKTIFECEGAKQCAIESSSLSKLGE